MSEDLRVSRPWDGDPAEERGFHFRQLKNSFLELFLFLRYNKGMTKPKKFLPKNARRVFKGVMFEVWQWKQKMFDGTTEIFEKIIRPDTIQVIPVVGNKILIEEQRQPGRSYFLSLVGGRRDKGESPLQSAKRELLEETGYVSKDWLLLKKELRSGRVTYPSYTYLAINCVKKANQNLDAGEKIKIKLISFNQFLMLSENKLFLNQDFINTLLKLRIYPKRKKEFYKLLFKD